MKNPERKDSLSRWKTHAIFLGIPQISGGLIGAVPACQKNRNVVDHMVGHIGSYARQCGYAKL